jgi:uncharacterized protein YdaU (DUF1376 family)
MSGVLTNSLTTNNQHHWGYGWVTEMKIRRIDFYPDDWIAGTIGLTDAERGVYIQVLMGIYSHGGPIHIDDAKALCGRQFAHSIETLIRRSKLTLTEQQLDSKRAATELLRSTNRTLTSQQNGSKGGRPNGLAKPDGSGDQKAINHQSSTINHQKETRASRALSNEGFDSWWESYPDKVGKGAARKAFGKALTKTSLDQLVTGIERYKATKPLDRSWCHPATWLNQERWNDDPGPVSNGHDISEHRKPRMPAPQV